MYHKIIKHNNRTSHFNITKIVFIFIQSRSIAWKVFFWFELSPTPTNPLEIPFLLYTFFQNISLHLEFSMIFHGVRMDVDRPTDQPTKRKILFYFVKKALLF